MRRVTAVALMMVVVLGGGAWGADRESARRAVATAFPDAGAAAQAGLARFLTALGNGETATVVYLGRTVNFVIRGGEVFIGDPRVTEEPTVPAAPPGKRQGSRAGEEMTGPDGGLYVWVPPGEFMMGSDDGDGDEKPAHRVRITEGFWLGRHEVTNAQYRAFCAATGRAFPSDSNQGDDHPVVNVSWEDARAYCEHHGLRLPTEAEWEWAARGPEGRRYPWGDGWDAGRLCWDQNRGPGGRTFPVGSFPAGASWVGALDMAGNVWEWVADWYDGGYYANSPTDDPQGPATGTSRVLRGGSWGRGPLACRSADRDRGDPTFRGGYGGFRGVVSPR